MAATDSTTPVHAPFDLGPVAYVVGRVLIILAVFMIAPAVLDWGNGNGVAFLVAMGVTGMVGILMTIATRHLLGRALNIRQAFLLTVGIWTVIPAFAALPLMLGAPYLNFTDAYFEMVSGITTTGATVIVGLDALPPGMNLWRGLMNWLGGLGIAFVAMIFLPVMRVGGMQFFRTEGFDTFGKVLPRATDIAQGLAAVYVILTLVIVGTYLALGVAWLDAVVYGFATVSTGGFTSSDLSFAKYPGAVEYAGAIFMLASALPFIRYVQLMRGSATPLLRDPQVAALLRWCLIAVWGVTLWQALVGTLGFEPTFRIVMFNLVSIMTGTGFSSGGFTAWEGPALVVAFGLGFIGGCSGSSTGALSVFRVQIALLALASQIRLLQSPHRIAPIRYAGRKVEQDVIDALMLYVTAFVLSMGVIAVLITMTGVDSYSALIASWASLGNIGYGFGPLVALTGTFRDYPDAAKWLMTLAMLMGRLGLLTMVVVFLPRFWQR